VATTGSPLQKILSTTGKRRQIGVAGLIFPSRVRMTSIPIYIRKANYEKIRRRAEATGKSIGAIINELIQHMD